MYSTLLLQHLLELLCGFLTRLFMGVLDVHLFLDRVSLLVKLRVLLALTPRQISLRQHWLG